MNVRYMWYVNCQVKLTKDVEKWPNTMSWWKVPCLPNPYPVGAVH
jgi:hypothetical protein